MLEQLHDRGLEAVRFLEDARRLVKHADAGLVRLLGDVGAVGQVEHSRRDHQQRDAGRVAAYDGDPEQGDAPGGETGRDGERDGPEQLRGRRTAFRDRDDALYHQRAQGVDNGDGGQPAQPAEDAEQRMVPDHGMEDELGDSGLEAQLGDVEDQLQRRLAAVEGEGDRCADGLRRHHSGRVGEVEAGDQRDLVQREAGRLAAELDVDDRDLAEDEESRQGPPGHLQRQARRREADHEPEVEDRSDRYQRDVQRPHPHRDPAHGGDCALSRGCRE